MSDVEEINTERTPKHTDELEHNHILPPEESKNVEEIRDAFVETDKHVNMATNNTVGFTERKWKKRTIKTRIGTLVVATSTGGTMSTVSKGNNIMIILNDNGHASDLIGSIATIEFATDSDSIVAHRVDTETENHGIAMAESN